MRTVSIATRGCVIAAPHRGGGIAVVAAWFAGLAHPWVSGTDASSTTVLVHALMRPSR
jgi:hypothetical protein